MEAATEPSGLKLKRENIPKELKVLDQWVGWSWKRIGEKWTKVPYDVKTGRNASSDDPSTWSPYSVTQDHDNIGFMFSADDPYTGVDLDSCVDPRTGEIAREARQIVERFASYAEISPSGTGVKVFLRGRVPGPRRKNPKKNMEVYDRLRFFTVTGHIVSEFEDVRDRQTTLDAFYEWLFPEREIVPLPQMNGLSANADLSDEDILSRAYRAANKDKFMRLWNGHSGATDMYESHSEADLALCSMLAFWTGPDHERIERMFSESGLSRGKWQDRPAYRKKTVSKALSDMTEFYSAQAGKTVRITPRKADDASGSGVSSFPFPRVSPLPEAPFFPTRALPDAAQAFVVEAARSMSVPEDYVGVPVLSTLAQGIGASRVVHIKRKWKEGTTLFLAVVSPPGTKKSPAADTALVPVWQRHFELVAEYEEKEEEYEQELRQHETAVKLAKKNSEVPPGEPKAPTPKRCITVDVTVEALIDLLANNPRGILVHRDELTGWVAAMDQYKGGKGSDKQHWLSLWSASPIAVDRKSQGGKATSVRRPSVSLLGNIQPAMLRELGNTAEEGLIERFLFAYPEYKRGRFTYDEISYEAENAYTEFYSTLISRYRMVTNGDSGKEEPNTTPITPEAKKLFGEYANTLGSQTEEPGFPHRLKGAFSKLEAYLGRISLILALCRCVQTGEVEQVQEEDVEAAYELVKYFGAHARRVHGETGAATPEEIHAAIVDELITDSDGAWEGTAEMLLEDLTERGIGGLPDSTRAVGKWIRRICSTTPALALIEKNVVNREDERRKGFKIERKQYAPTQTTQTTQTTQETAETAKTKGSEGE